MYIFKYIPVCVYESQKFITNARDRLKNIFLRILTKYTLNTITCIGLVRFVKRWNQIVSI